MNYGHAIAFAAECHKDQTRKFTEEPYILHPLEVAEKLRSWGRGEVEIIAGVLHDILEDTNATPSQIRMTFGQAVLVLVQHVTKEEHEGNKRERCVAEDARLMHVVNKSSAHVKVADIYSNLSAFDLAMEHNPRWAIPYLDAKQATYLLLRDMLASNVVVDMELLFTSIRLRHNLFDAKDMNIRMQEARDVARSSENITLTYTEGSAETRSEEEK